MTKMPINENRYKYLVNDLNMELLDNMAKNPNTPLLFAIENALEKHFKIVKEDKFESAREAIKNI